MRINPEPQGKREWLGLIATCAIFVWDIVHVNADDTNILFGLIKVSIPIPINIKANVFEGSV